MGAGTTLAAQALGQISGFNTNTAITTSTTPYPLDALAFANYTNLGTPTQSTKLGGFGDAPCSPVISAPTTISTASTISATPSSSTTYNVSLLKINFSSTVGNKTTIYVNGDVYIKNNISFGTFTSLDQIPSLNIVANGGNIYIDPSVTSLEGTYMAIRGSSGTGGAIYDCSTDSLAGKYPANPATGNNQCFDNTLTINGSFIAHDVYFQRTKGNAATNSGAAEQFNYGPEQWLSSPTSTSSSIETIQSLPPLF